MARRTLLVAALVAAVAAGTAAARTGARADTNCAERSDHARIVHFRTSDRVRLAGLAFGSGRTGIVLAHQVDGDLCAWLPFARVLKAAGFRVLAFDFRNFGSSQHVGSSVHLERDVVAAAAEIRRLGAARVFLVGASMGGTAVVTAAPSVRPAVAGVVSLSGPSTFVDMDALAAAKTLHAPALFVVGRYDHDFVADVKTQYAAARSKDKRLVVRPNGYHGTLLLDGAEGAPLRRIVLGFFRSRR
jgi:pimeloyl-ACP methyl ester carboxylesterase